MTVVPLSRERLLHKESDSIKKMASRHMASNNSNRLNNVPNLGSFDAVSKHCIPIRLALSGS